MSSSLPSVGEAFRSLPSPRLVSPSSSTNSTHSHHHQHARHEDSFSRINSSSQSNSNYSHSNTSRLTGLVSIPIRAVQYGVSILFRIRAALPAMVRPWFWVGLWLVFAMVGVAVFAGFHTRIFELLETMAGFIKGLGRAGPPIIMLGLFLTAFPPLFGYSSLVTMSGYVYGFGFGLCIAYTSALLGSIACFYLCRRWFKVQVRALMAKRQGMKSVVKAVEKRGFKLMLLIRLAPYPFNVMNALLSATHIPLSTFALATAISLVKLALHVYIGSTLSSLAVLPPPPLEGGDGDTTAPLPGPADGNSHGRNLKIVVMVLSMILGFAVGAYVWVVAKREIEASEGIRIERRRKRRESMRLGRASMRSSSGGVSGNAAAALVAGRGSGRAPEGSSLLARSGSSSALEQPGNSDRVPAVDLAGATTALGISDFVGGVANGTQYMDYDEGQEDQALVGHHNQYTSETTLASPFDYGSDSDSSDFLDDEDENMNDVERGVEDTALFQQDDTEMSVRSPTFPLLQPRPQRAAERETMGWFADNGVDISDGW